MGPKGAAKIEITYIEVNHSATTYTGQDEEPETEDEQIVLAPENIKEIYIDLDGYTELQVSPIKPNRFVSRSGSFPLEQKWTRPQGLRYPVEAEVTLELVVKNTRYLTQPYPIPQGYDFGLQSLRHHVGGWYFAGSFDTFR